jgi:prepilin-type N-terminal cleavage/methylation domain-containing protein
MRQDRMKNSKGFSLLEILLVMSIVAIILIGVARYYESATAAHKENEALHLVQALKAAGERFRIGSSTPEDILQRLINRNLVPISAKTNPWGGAVKVALAADGKITITLATIPVDACDSLVKIFNTDAVNPTAECTVGTESGVDFMVSF